jgi:hypothetical protein
LTVKEQMLKIVQDLPDDATVEEAMERLYLWLKIQNAEAQIRSGQVISHSEARERMAKWLQG